MRMFHKIGIGLIDLGIIAVVLFYLTASAQRLEIGLGADMARLYLIVIVAYLIVAGITTLFCSAFMGESWFVRVSRAALSTGFMLWLFPKLLMVILWIFSYAVSADVETVLTWTIIIRTAVRAFLGRRWGGKEQ